MKFKNVILIFSIFVAIHANASMVVTGLKELGKGIGSQAISSGVTGGAWGAMIATHMETTNSKSIDGSIKRINDELLHDQHTGYRPKFLYSFLRRIVNFGDITISGGNLPWYLAKKSSDLVLVNVFGKITEEMEKRLESRYKPNYQQFFRGLDETIDWDNKLTDNKYKYGIKGTTALDYNDSNSDISPFVARFITTATLGRLITTLLLTKLFPLISAKVPSNGKPAKFYNSLARLFKYTDSVFYAHAIKNKSTSTKQRLS
jgi:hypothetical protein